jgi:diguanylate cyclase (GGDEF)-like protein
MQKMNPDINNQQIFSWALQLTTQVDYQSLTYCFLGLLEEICFVENATAYEVYGKRTLRTGEASSVSEQLIRRFPLDFTEYELDESSDLLQEIDNKAMFYPSKPDGNGYFTQFVASLTDLSGPDRVILLHGIFDERSLELLSNLINLYRNQVALHDSKERDILTKLPNRQSFHSRFLQVCEYFRNNKKLDNSNAKGSWLAMLDIDHFKRINDTFGHLIGDEILLTFSQIMEKQFRYNDFLFRFGGEEFIVILNLVNQGDAEATFERFRNAIAGYAFPIVGQVTVSIGVAHINCDIMPTSLLDRADKALYFAKDNGRNNVTLYEKMKGSSLDSDNVETEFF